MKSKIAAPLAVLVLLIAALTMTGGTTASAEDGPCVPKDAWTETIEHPAITHVVHHEAVTHVVHHEAVTHPEYRYERTVEDTTTEWRFVKYTHTKTKPKHGEWSAYGPWTQWSPISHESWQATNVEALGSPAFHGSGETGTGNNKVEWYREWQARNTGETREVPNGSTTETTDWLLGPPDGEGWVQIDEREVTDSEAYDETVVDSEAYDETVIDKAAWTEVIEHPAVTCDKPPVVEPPVVNPPVVQPPVVQPPKVQPPKVATPDVPTVIDAGV